MIVGIAVPTTVASSAARNVPISVATTTSVLRRLPIPNAKVFPLRASRRGDHSTGRGPVRLPLPDERAAGFDHLPDGRDELLIGERLAKGTHRAGRRPG